MPLKKRRRKPTPKRPGRLPLELAILEDQMRLGVIRFRMRLEVWHSEDGKPNGVWRYLKRGFSLWEAGSVEELLAAVEGAKIALHNSAGVRPHRHVKCERCQRWVGMAGHSKRACDAAIDESRKSIEWARRFRGKKDDDYQEQKRDV